MRARLDVLSEIPREWRQAVRRWQRLNRRLKSRVDDVRVPETNEEYLIYQTLVGVWPMDGVDADLPDAEREALAVRIGAYMTKARARGQAAHELDQRERPLRARHRSVRRAACWRRPRARPFLADLRRFVGGIAHAGRSATRSCRSCSRRPRPGVPDFYQGTELWDLSLVDPDNRRPVDYAPRRALLADIAHAP